MGYGSLWYDWISSLWTESLKPTLKKVAKAKICSLSYLLDEYRISQWNSKVVCFILNSVSASSFFLLLCPKENKLSFRFSLHFEESFPNIKKFSSHRVKGCIKSHPENCAVCHLIPSDQITEIKRRDKTTIHGQKMKGFTFRLWMFGLNCETRMVVYAVDCKVCCKHFVKTSVQPLAKIACQNQDLSILLGKHALCKENCKVVV